MIETSKGWSKYDSLVSKCLRANYPLRDLEMKISLPKYMIKYVTYYHVYFGIFLFRFTL